MTSRATTPTASVPLWIGPQLSVQEGRDPLGLQTTTQDRIMPLLLPGVLELTQRARYLAFHAFLLAEYRRLRYPANLSSLSTFVKRREWDFGLAVLVCPRGCGSSPVGANRLRPVVHTNGQRLPRGESVKSPLGGYGLYYRSPLAELGIVARAGTMLGDTAISVDVLTESPRAAALASTFGDTVRGTDYYRTWMSRDEDVPIEVIRDLADVACLCQLSAHPEERDAVLAALFELDADSKQEPEQHLVDPADSLDVAAINVAARAATQRRDSFALYLSLVDADPTVVTGESAYRESLWSPPVAASSGTSERWAALIAKDVWQDALCSIWTEFCTVGLKVSRDKGRGLTWTETETLVRDMTAGPPQLAAGTTLEELTEHLTSGAVLLSSGINAGEESLEGLRAWTVRASTATSGLVVLLELARRAQERTDPGWREVSALDSAWQPSLAAVLAALNAHMTTGGSVSDALWWIVERHVLRVHEHVAYSKLPEFTFRFRWESGLLQFYDNGVGRFPLASIRRQPFATLTRDLDLWEPDSNGQAHLTVLGRAFASDRQPR